MLNEAKKQGMKLAVHLSEVSNIQHRCRKMILIMGARLQYIIFILHNKPDCMLGCGNYYGLLLYQK